MLQFRASLEVRHTDATRLPMKAAWTPPIDGLTSFCDVGAFDGDTLEAMARVMPGLTRTFTVEPNPDLEPAITGTAAFFIPRNASPSGAGQANPP